tara:strand:+ start:691 stop:999 length:309 start_codon:yes stop_codon:yes gene_type:complete
MKGTGSKKKFILKKSDRKGKRFEIIMSDHSHHFGSNVGKTFIDHKDKDKKSAWIARHQTNKNYNSKHSGIFHSKELLWTEPSLDKAINRYEKKYGVNIIKKI